MNNPIFWFAVGVVALGIYLFCAAMSNWRWLPLPGKEHAKVQRLESHLLFLSTQMVSLVMALAHAQGAHLLRDPSLTPQQVDEWIDLVQGFVLKYWGFQRAVLLTTSLAPASSPNLRLAPVLERLAMLIERAERVKVAWSDPTPSDLRGWALKFGADPDLWPG